MVWPPRLVQTKKAFGSGLYIPHRGALGGQPYFLVEKVFLRNTLIDMFQSGQVLLPQKQSESWLSLYLTSCLRQPWTEVPWPSWSSSICCIPYIKVDQTVGVTCCVHSCWWCPHLLLPRHWKPALKPPPGISHCLSSATYCQRPATLLHQIGRSHKICCLVIFTGSCSHFMTRESWLCLTNIL